MEKKTLRSCIETAQRNDEAAMLELLHKFKPLIGKLAWELPWECDDAQQEMRLAFIMLIQKMDTKRLSEEVIVAYIAVAMRNAFIQISKAHKRQAEHDQHILVLGGTYVWADHYEALFWDEVQTKVNAREFLILQMHYGDGFSVEMIAQRMGIARQNVNKAKNKAIVKLRECYGRENMNSAQKRG